MLSPGKAGSDHAGLYGGDHHFGADGEQPEGRYSCGVCDLHPGVRTSVCSSAVPENPVADGRSEPCDTGKLKRPYGGTGL